MEACDADTSVGKHFDELDVNVVVAAENVLMKILLVVMEVCQRRSYHSNSSRSSAKNLACLYCFNKQVWIAKF